MNNTILIIEDEQKIRRVIKDYLLKDNFKVLEAEDGQKGIEIFEKENVDLIILDIMMPKLNGWEVCREIRKKSDALIVMLTAKSEEEDTLYGYDLGADDYVTKPFKVKVLVAKIKALLSRQISRQKNNIQANMDLKTFRYNKLTLDLQAQTVYVENNLINLTSKEYNLLVYFIQNSNMSLSRNQILDAVWGDEYFGADRAVDACIKRLRAKIGEQNLPVTAVRGYGYRFEVN